MDTEVAPRRVYELWVCVNDVGGVNRAGYTVLIENVVLDGVSTALEVEARPVVRVVVDGIVVNLCSGFGNKESPAAVIVDDVVDDLVIVAE